MPGREAVTETCIVLHGAIIGVNVFCRILFSPLARLYATVSFCLVDAESSRNASRHQLSAVRHCLKLLFE